MAGKSVSSAQYYTPIKSKNRKHFNLEELMQNNAGYQ